MTAAITLISIVFVAAIILGVQGGGGSKKPRSRLDKIEAELKKIHKHLGIEKK